MSFTCESYDRNRRAEHYRVTIAAQSGFQGSERTRRRSFSLPIAMISLKFNTSSIADGVLLVSGAGDRDTGGGLCALDAESSETVDRVSTSGMAVFEGRLARLLRTPLSTGGGEILIYDGRGISHYLRVDELSDSHTIAWAGEDVIVSSTGTNSLLWISLSGKVLRRWRAPGEDDSWHLNDVCLVGGRVHACSFGRFAHYRGYKDHILTGTGFVFDIVSGRSVVTGLCAPHSPRYFDGAWTVCDSSRNSVVQVDAEGHRIQQAMLRSFTRGLAVTDDYLIVGESAQRAPGGGSAVASVAILRRVDFSFVARLNVPFSEIGEIVVVPRDLLQAVKTGFRTNALRVSESDQLQMFRDVGIEPKRLWAVSEVLTSDQCKVRIDAEFPASFICGKPTLVSCTVQNLSEVFLCSEAPYPVLLSYRWKDSRDSAALASDDGNRTRLPCMLPPGSSISFRVDVKAPDVEGEFELLMTLVQEHVIWFDSVDHPSNVCCAKVKVVRAESAELLRNSCGCQRD